MSQFGQRDIGLVQQPAARPNTSGIRAMSDMSQIFGEAVNAARGIVQLQTQSIGIDAEQQLAQQRLTQAEAKHEMVLQQIGDVQAQQQYTELAEREWFGITAELSRMNEDQQMQFLRENPAFDDKNKEKLSRIIGDNITSALKHRLRGDVLDAFNQGQEVTDGFVSDRVMALLGEYSDADPTVMAEVQRAMFASGSGLIREILSIEGQQQRASLRQGARDRVQTVAIDFLEGDADWDAVQQSQDDLQTFDPSADADGVAWYQSVAASIYGGIDRKLRMGVDVTDAIERLEQTDDPRLKRHLTRLGFYDNVNRHLESQRRGRVNAFSAGVIEAAKHEEALNNPSGIRQLLDRLDGDAPEGMTKDELGELRTNLSRRVQLIEHGDRLTTEYMNILRDGGELTPEHRDPAIENRVFNSLIRDEGMSESQALSYMVQQVGRVPQSIMSTMRRDLSPESLNLNRVLSHYRAIEQHDPALAQRLMRNIENNKTGRALTTFTADLAEDDPVVGRAVGVLSSPLASDAFAAADAALAVGSEPIQASRADRKIPGVGEVISNPRLMLARSLGTADVSESSVIQFEDLYRYYTAEAMAMRPGITPDAALMYAEQKAGEHVSRSMLSIRRGDPLSNNIFRDRDVLIERRHLGLGPSSDASDERLARSAMTDFARIVADGGSTFIPESARMIDNKTYMYAAEEDGEITNILEIDLKTKERRFIDSTNADFEALSRGVDPNTMLGGRWHYIRRGETVQQRTLSEFDRLFGTSRGDQALDAAVEEWTETYGEPPTLTSQEFKDFATEFVRNGLNWENW